VEKSFLYDNIENAQSAQNGAERRESTDRLYTILYERLSKFTKNAGVHSGGHHVASLNGQDRQNGKRWTHLLPLGDARMKSVIKTILRRNHIIDEFLKTTLSIYIKICYNKIPIKNFEIWEKTKEQCYEALYSFFSGKWGGGDRIRPN
jgi:ribosomal protein S19